MHITVSSMHAGVTSVQIEQNFEKLQVEIQRMKHVVSRGDYNSVYASLLLPQDDVYFQKIKILIEQKKQLHSSVLVVIGIGGSNLGTVAVQEALLGKLYNEKKPALKIYYADTIDSHYIFEILQLVKNELGVGNKVLINVVTKSGSTTESIANFEIFLHLLMQYHPHDYADYIVVTTDNDSSLWKVAQQEKFSLLEIPKNVGGRYSVFSAVGLFPLGLLGCDISLLRQGAADMVQSCLSLKLNENYAVQTACTLYTLYTKNICIQDMFLFAVQLEGVGKWYRQLMGESIGKEFDVSGKKVEVGITPTVSLGTVDLHSVGQLYLGGPRDKATTFVSIKNHVQDLIIPTMAAFEHIAKKIQGVSMDLVMQATLQGVQAAYIKNNRPFMAIELPACSEYYLGQLLQYKMVEMIYLGYLLNVNPFDQPNVESYKDETRNILARR